MSTHFKIKILSTAATLFLVSLACSPRQKTVTSTPNPDTPAAGTPVPASVKPKDGIYEPGNEELFAMRMRYTDITMSTLRSGHLLYTGICTNCHSAFPIYQYNDASWKEIIDRMAEKIKMNDTDKDAVFKYVLAIKATQPR